MGRRAFLMLAAGCVVFGFCGSGRAQSQAAPVSQPPLQMILTLADGWNSNHALLQCYERASVKAPWQPALPTPVKVNLGKNGLAWGIGERPVPRGNGVPDKMEGDRRAPAGYFQLGTVYGYAPGLPGGSRGFRYRQLTAWDAWVDDVKSPLYNRHVVINPKEGIPPWFEKAKMRHGDFAYEWLLEVRHNSNPPVPGAGSAIFFHIRRGPESFSFGCTTMPKPDLEKILRWLKPGAFPRSVLLTRGEYQKARQPWDLPVSGY